MEKPKFFDAPGCVVRPMKSGWEVRWQARTDLVVRGYTPKSQYIMQIKVEPTAGQRDFVTDICHRMQDDMIAFGQGGVPKVGPYDGSIRDLIGTYQTDEASPYNEVRYATRQNYDAQLLSLSRSLPEGAMVKDINARQAQAWHRDWSQRSASSAHGLIAMLRMVVKFGWTFHECRECQRAMDILRAMRFASLSSREEVLTVDQVIAIRMAAHKRGWHEIALAQAIQFECTFRQKDVIGEWVPYNEKGASEIQDVRREQKWLRGIRWSEIDENLILKHVTSKKNKKVEINLRLAPMVMEELPLIGDRPTTGPVIIDPKTGLPYQNYMFRRRWRMLADECGIPRSVKNMDTRAGAITEGTDVASLEDVRHAATHSNISMTQKYSRQQAKKTANVMELRVKSRNKTGT